MKTIVIVVLATMLAMPAYAAACGPGDFAIQGFEMDAQMHGNRARLELSGTLVNNCADPAGAEIKILAKDKNGNVIETQTGWPTGSSNIPPGTSIDFNFGALFDYKKTMATFSAAIISARTW